MPEDPYVGVTIESHYRIDSRIARGGMATVYKAHDLRLDRDVAVKILYSHLAENPQFIERFHREARSAAKLVHPSIVGIYDQGSIGDTVYLVMEYVDGPNLRDTLVTYGSLPVGQSLKIIAQLFDALSQAHRAGFIHRDIKPENILLAPNGHIKVADFGLARMVSEVTNASSSVVLGTAAYLAPELSSGETADARSDVYSCGILLYELLTGKQPFTGDMPIQVVLQHINSPMPAPSATIPWLPASLDSLVAMLTAKNPADRPVDAAAALTLLRKARQDIADRTILDRVPTATQPDATQELANTHGTQENANDTDLNPTRIMDTPDKKSSKQAAKQARRRKKNAKQTSPGSDDEPRNALGTPSEKYHRLRRNALISMVAILIPAIILVTWVIFSYGPMAKATVPNVAGMTLSSAENALKSAGFTPAPTAVYSDTIAAGNVIGTDPTAGTRLAKNGNMQVVLNVSKGIRRVTMPDVTGKSAADAKTALKSAGFDGQVSTTETYNDTVPANNVISTTPTAKTVANHNAPITLTVSQGPTPVSVPNVVGMSSNDAKNLLTSAALSLKVATSEAFSDTVPQGNVISQNPAADATAHHGDTVTLVVSKGPQMTTVPAVTGMGWTVDKATAALTGANLTVNPVLIGGVGSNTIVYAQTPAAGQSVHVGTSVKITYIKVP